MKIYCRRLENYQGSIEIGGIYELANIDGVMYWIESPIDVRINGKLPGIMYSFKEKGMKLRSLGKNIVASFPFDYEQYELALKSGILW